MDINKIITEEINHILTETFKNPNVANNIRTYADSMQRQLDEIMNDGVHSRRDIVLLDWQKAIDMLNKTADRIS